MNTEFNVNKFRYYMALLATAGLFVLIYSVIRESIAEGSRDVVMFAFGVVSSIVKDIYGYYFGSSEGSAKKDLLAKNLLENKMQGVSDAENLTKTILELPLEPANTESTSTNTTVSVSTT